MQSISSSVQWPSLTFVELPTACQLVYPGAFSPVHMGHLVMMDQALRFLIPGISQEVERNECISECVRSCIYLFLLFFFTITSIYVYICMYMYSVIILNYSYLASIHCTRRFYLRIDRKRNTIAEYISQYSWTTPCISIILEFCCWRNGKYDWFCDQGPVVIGDTCMLHSICLKHYISIKISALTPKVWFPAGLVDGFFFDRQKEQRFLRGISLKSETDRRIY